VANLKSRVRGTLRTFKLDRVVRAAFESMLWLQVGWNRAVGAVYARAWPTFNIPYYDHRATNLRGIEHWQWTTRGQYALFEIPERGHVLEIACGDGMYAAVFYATRAAHVDAIDIDEDAIRRAHRRYPRANVQYRLSNALTDPFPSSAYDTVCCFATMQYFTLEELNNLLQKVGKALRPDTGAYVGMIPLYPPGVHDVGSKTEYRTAPALSQLLQTHFQSVKLYATAGPKRTDVFFTCRHPIALIDDQIRHAVEQQRPTCDTN
jgi:SAM-dependent methyltransferase